jgi:hypothetical protein
MKYLLPTISLICLATYTFGADTVEQPKDIRGNADKPFAYTGEDLTRLPTRLGASYESGANHDTGSNSDKYLVTGSLSLMGFQALAEVPVYARYNPGAGETQDGFGNSFVSGAFSLPLNPKFRLAFGLDALLNTSSRDELGLDETIYSPFIGAGVELDKDSMFLGKFSYTDSSDNTFERVEFLLRGLHRWNDQLFTSVSVTPGWDNIADKVLLNARALAGARIDRHNVASIEFELPIDSTSREQRGTSLRMNYSFLF